MNLDLHLHSVYSVDSPVKPEQYAKIMAEMHDEYDVSGFVLMEHNYLIKPDDVDLEALGREYGLVVLAGVEVDTFWGHLLVYGMTEKTWEKIQAGGARKQEPIELAKMLEAEGAACVPAHPFRFYIGMGTRSRELAGVGVIEGLIGSNDEAENSAAMSFAKKMGWAATGGSDGHFKAELGKALTSFEKPITTMDDLVREIKAGRCSPLWLEQAIIK